MALNSILNKLHQYHMFVIGILMLFSCASIQTPQGGPKDNEPPKVLLEVPKNLTRNFKSDKILITLDEFFKLNNEYQEITISPSQVIPPTYKIKQKTLEITFNDSLEYNSTYTINFGKAIQDINESTTLENYTYVFSTGNTIDSLQISGKVISSINNKVVEDAVVFIFPLEKDSLFTKKRAAFSTTTDTSGNFKLRNIKSGKYKIYALKEGNSGDRIYNDANEEIGFSSEIINLEGDIANITLKLFKQEAQKFLVKEQKIQDDEKIFMVFNKAINNPSVAYLENTIDNDIIEFSTQGDTLSIWPKNTNYDSLKVVIKSDNIALDTLKFNKVKLDNPNKTISFTNNLSKGKITPGSRFTFQFNRPIRSIDKSKILLIEDSISVSNFTFNPIENSSRNYVLSYPFKIKKLYSLTFKEDGITDIYGNKNKLLQTKFSKDEDENYGNLSLKFLKSDTSKSYIIQLLTENETIVKTDQVVDKTTLNYIYLDNGKYKIRIIEDSNKNGKYDSGNVFKNLQPEKTWIVDKEIIVRPSWDQEFQITIPDKFT